jgi:muconolactone delta-isomerase
MINPTNQFMVDFTLPQELSREFMDLIPFQRAVVDRYLSDGSLVNYALALEHAKLWAIFNANSEMEVLEMLTDFPLTPFMQIEINELTSFSTAELSPAFSLN